MKRNVLIYSTMTVALIVAMIIAKMPLSEWFCEVEWDFIGALFLIFLIPAIIKTGILKINWRNEIRIRYKIIVSVSVTLYQFYLCFFFVSNDYYLFRFEYDISTFIGLIILLALFNSVNLIFSENLHYWLRVLYLSLITTLLFGIANLLLLYPKGDFSENCNLYFIFVVFYGAIIQRFILEMLDSHRKQKIILSIVGVAAVIFITCFYMSYQIDRISDFSSQQTAQVYHSPCGEYTLYYVDPEGKSASYYLTNADSKEPIFIASQYNLTGFEGYNESYKARWLYENEECIGFTFNAYHYNFPWIELPPTLWDRLRTWLILQKYPELSNPEFIKSLSDTTSHSDITNES